MSDQTLMELQVQDIEKMTGQWGINESSMCIASLTPKEILKLGSKLVFMSMKDLGGTETLQLMLPSATSRLPTFSTLLSIYLYQTVAKM